jgi:hypothetical protein
MKTTHTPTPWYVGNPSWDGGPPDEVYFTECNQDGESFLFETGGNYANAEFIVRAVNSHEALLEALQGFLEVTSKQAIYRFMEPQRAAAHIAITLATQAP